MAGQTYTEDRFGHRRPLAVQGESGLVEVPAGIPDGAWTNRQLDAYAQRAGVDVGTAKNKADRLAAIDAHRAATQPALPPGE
ncbi:MAG: hypothetical protein K0S37_2603 [Microbacterium sp.]|jgi:hypothetical protein|nr:hypothetical protein [Microbacterium sp.]